jgi:tetratricopeptide (TPR) repeat protein
MPFRYCWTAFLMLACCASLFDRRSDMERGLDSYERRAYAEAAGYFDAYYTRNPAADSMLYYLFSCYKQLGRIDDQISTLEKLAARKTRDVNVYLNLVHLYRAQQRYGALFNMLARLEPPISNEIDQHLILTRRFYAELACGAAAADTRTDPLVFCASKGFLPVAPDGQIYEDDTITTAIMIVLLDRLVEPLPPRSLYPTQNIPARSYLYLPYMRLVNLGILEFDAYVVPEYTASVLTAVRAIGKLKERRVFG